MRVAHFDCFSGISGDMTLGALIDAGVEAAAVRAAVASLGLPVTLEIEKVRLEKDSAYLERVARKELGMAKPDEKVFRFVQPNNPKK